MSEKYRQSGAARGEIKAAAQERMGAGIMSGSAKSVAKQMGVSERTVNRWRAFLRGDTGKEKSRNPFAKSANKIAQKATGGKVRINIKGNFMWHGSSDPGYVRFHDVTREIDAGILALADKDPQAALQQFMDEYHFNGKLGDVAISFDGYAEHAGYAAEGEAGDYDERNEDDYDGDE